MPSLDASRNAASKFARAFLGGLNLRAGLALAALAGFVGFWLTLAEPEIWLDPPRFANGGREPVSAMAFVDNANLWVGGVRGAKVLFDIGGQSGVILQRPQRHPGAILALAVSSVTNRRVFALSRNDETPDQGRYVATSAYDGGVLESRVSAIPFLAVSTTDERWYVARKNGSAFEIFPHPDKTSKAWLLDTCCDNANRASPPDVTALGVSLEGPVVGTRDGDVIALLEPAQPADLPKTADKLRQQAVLNSRFVLETLSGPVDLIAIAGDATVVAAATRNGEVNYNGNKLSIRARRLSLSKEGSRLTTVSADGDLEISQIRALNSAKTGKLMQSLDRRPIAPAALDAILSPDGQTVVAAFSDLTVRIYDVSRIFTSNGAAREIAVCRGHKDPVAVMALSPDGAKVAVADVSGRVSITDIARAARLARFEAPLRAAWRVVSGSAR